MSRLLIRGGVLPDPGVPRGRRVDIVVEDGRIADLLADASPRPGDAEVVDAAGCAIIPGLVNAHMHGHANLAKGMGDRWTLEMSLTNAAWVSGARTLEAVYASAAIGAAEMLLKGCTACYDMVMEVPLPSEAGLDAVARAYDDVGMRAVLAPMVADIPFFDAIPGLRAALEGTGHEPPRAQEDLCAAILSRLEAQLAGWRFPRDRLRMALGPTIPLLCSQAFLYGCRDLAREHGAGLHTHLAESKVQAVTAATRDGRSIPKTLADLGILSPALACAHGVWLDGDDRLRLADAGARVVHNPGSNFRLGSGIADVRAMLDAGIVVGLGTDGATCADSLNMFEAMRLATHASRTFGRRPQTWLTAAQALAAATEGSAQALGFGGEIGRIAVGSAADLVLLDLSRPHYVPRNDLTAQIVYGEDSSGVRDVFVAGRRVVRDRRLTTVDLGALAARVTDVAAAFHEENAPRRALAQRMAPVVASFCHGMIEADWSPSHYVPGAPAVCTH